MHPTLHPVVDENANPLTLVVYRIMSFVSSLLSADEREELVRASVCRWARICFP